MACPPTELFLQHSIRHLVMVNKADQVPRTVSDFAIQWEGAYGKSWLPEPTTSELCHKAKESGHAGRSAGVAVGITPLVGREPELRFLHTRLITPKTRPQLIVVMGEAGIGKTRLIDETGRRIRLDGVRTLAARGAEFEDCIPLNPIIDVLTQLSEEDLSALGEPWISVLRGLLPITQGVREKTMPPPLRPLSVSRRLMEAFLLLFEQLSGPQPLALFLDDVHWMDETSLAVIQFVRRRAKGDLTIVLVLTTELIQRRPCVQEFLTSINAECEHLALEGLDPTAAEEIVDHLTQGCLPTQTLESICALGAGNAFYLTELAAEADAGRIEFTAEPDEPAIPPSVQNLLSRDCPSFQQMLEICLQFSRSRDRHSLLPMQPKCSTRRRPPSSRRTRSCCVLGLWSKMRPGAVSGTRSVAGPCMIPLARRGGGCCTSSWPTFLEPTTNQIGGLWRCASTEPARRRRPSNTHCLPQSSRNSRERFPKPSSTCLSLGGTKRTGNSRVRSSGDWGTSITSAKTLSQRLRSLGLLVRA